MKPQSLYDRLGGIFAIAAVVNNFSDALLDNPVVGKNSPNPFLSNWHRNEAPTRLPGLKWMRTLWLADLAGGPYKFVPTHAGRCPFSLENAHARFAVSPDEFDAVAGELAKALDAASVPSQEKKEVLAVFSQHKNEVNQGYYVSTGQPPKESPTCPFKAVVQEEKICRCVTCGSPASLVAKETSQMFCTNTCYNIYKSEK